MKIGTLAKLSGVPIETIQYYERAGLLSNEVRTGSGRRDYQTKAVAQLHFLQQCKAVGLSVEETKLLAEMNLQSDLNDSQRRTIRSKLDVVRNRLLDLSALEQRLLDMLEQRA
ncbi:MerR family transcriptional regulator [Salinibius halmophilus]|uniref:MerR family transcriptional regulator n=1 Tax=Salinibius halmophilus TaxID=1853216 RepID=UPI000E669D7C|nr:MerR family transcriptional regulator [Salinibius halmophilus]